MKPERSNCVVRHTMNFYESFKEKCSIAQVFDAPSKPVKINDMSNTEWKKGNTKIHRSINTTKSTNMHTRSTENKSKNNQPSKEWLHNMIISLQVIPSQTVRRENEREMEVEGNGEIKMEWMERTTVKATILSTGHSGQCLCSWWRIVKQRERHR